MEIASPRKTPTETAPLVASPRAAGARRYGAVKPPALHITIPPPALPRLPPPTDEGEFVVDLDGGGRVYAYAATPLPYTDECTCDCISPRTVCCDYCQQHNLYHPPPRREHPPEDDTPPVRAAAAAATAPRRSGAENEGPLAVLEFLIDLQMQLLAVLVPGLLVLILVVVVLERDA